MYEKKNINNLEAAEKEKERKEVYFASSQFEKISFRYLTSLKWIILYVFEDKAEQKI